MSDEILKLVARLRDYENCSDGDVDEAANLIHRMHQLLVRAYGVLVGDLTPGLRDDISDLLHASDADSLS